MKKFIAILLVAVVLVPSLFTVAVAEVTQIGKSDSIDDVISSIFSMYTGVTYTTAQENLLKAVRSDIAKNGRFIGVVYNEYGDHCWFFENRGWTILIRGNQFIWAIPWEGGQLFANEECIHYDGYDWFYAEHLESEDNVESELIMLWWMEWQYAVDDEAEETEERDPQIIHIK